VSNAVPHSPFAKEAGEVKSRRLLTKMLSKRYRDAYVAENVRTGIAYQIRALRQQRGPMSQKDLGRLTGKPQCVVSRLEDPDYGRFTLQTLLDVAAAFDVALLVQFVSHDEFLRRTRDVSPEALEVPSFASSLLGLEATDRE
jgi:transcriptional regulator with XRE-family HTH domain